MASSSQVFAALVLYSSAMFTLPFAAFFGAKFLMSNYLEVSTFTNTVCCSTAAVLTVNIIIAMYVIKAYREAEFESSTPVDEKKEE